MPAWSGCYCYRRVRSEKAICGQLETVCALQKVSKVTVRISCREHWVKWFARDVHPRAPVIFEISRCPTSVLG